MFATEVSGETLTTCSAPSAKSFRSRVSAVRDKHASIVLSVRAHDLADQVEWTEGQRESARQRGGDARIGEPYAETQVE
jgi:hypothetical protein